ncbi:phytanoyl-CoA dioxygenase, partial [bacterium LRH843]|nr:phytanoyl-CoA dioxygenase [bacterium LRH843]
GGRFFDDYCNWSRIPEFERAIREGPAARVAAALMGSARVQLFHDHVLVKEPGTARPTPWHQDAPYYFVEGRQTVSFWCPLDPVEEATLR